MTHPRRHRSAQLRRTHALSAVIIGMVVLWLVLYARADPQTHLGAFYGNAIADWLGVLVFVVATKYFFETGSGESRTPAAHFHVRVARVLLNHSLTIVLSLTGIAWIVVYAHSDADSKAGQVI